MLKVMAVFEKINVLNVFKEHVETLRNANTNSYSIGDFFLFLLFPALLAIVLVYNKINLTKEVILILVTSLSIFAALLFNLLLIIYDIVTKLKEDGSRIINNNSTQKEQTISRLFKKERLIKETYVNISYNITIAIITIIFSLILFFIINTTIPNNENTTVMASVENSNIAILFFSFVIYYFLIQFMLTLFMILKRIHVLLSKEFKELGKAS